MRKTFLFLIASMLFMAGCIHNDLPYPVVVPNVTSMTVQDAVKVDIDYEAREVVVYVSETTDLRITFSEMMRARITVPELHLSPRLSSLRAM